MKTIKMPKPLEPIPPGTYKVVLRETIRGMGKYEILDGHYAGRYVFVQIVPEKIRVDWITHEASE